MMETRSQSTVSEDMKAYFKSLIAPLATQEQINQLKMEITSSFEDVVKEQLKKIHTLEKKVSDQEKIIEELSIKCDLSQQYSRRSCLRIHGVEVVKGTEPENIMTTLEDCYKKLDLPYNSENRSSSSDWESVCRLSFRGQSTIYNCKVSNMES